MKSINILLLLSISIAQVVTASEPDFNCEEGGSEGDLDHNTSDTSMYYQEDVEKCKSIEEDRPTCNQVHTERRHKFGLKYYDQLPEELKLTSLPMEWKGMTPWEVEAERRHILGVKKREKLPPHLSNLPSKVVYLAGQIMAEDSELSLEDAIMQARVALGYTRKSYKSSSSTSEASKEKQKAKKSNNV